MSSWNPPPEGSGGWPGDPGRPPPDPQPQDPGYIPPPGQGAGPPPGQGYGQPPGQGYGPGQDFGQPPGPGLPAPEWYGTPGMGGYQPPGRRRGILRRAGIGGVVLLVVIIVASVLVYQHDNHPWELTAPSTAAGMPRDTDPLDTLGLSTGVTDARSSITSVSGYGTLKSLVSAAYQNQSGSGPLIWFIGFNGTFSKQIVLERYQGARIQNVNAGPHGGVAECASSKSATFCQWSTNSTVGELLIRASSILGGPVSTATADSLVIRMRNSVEHPRSG
jgi:hypothetical protein